MKPHAFIAMPFGEKPNTNGEIIDFNRVYAELIKPALEDAGLEVFRADEEQQAGDILTDMFQELLMADLVVADLTIDNPNVWYELGVRHALRARGVVLVCGDRINNAFDLHAQRKLRYGIEGGGPDKQTVEQDKQKLTAMVKETMESWHGSKISPVYELIPYLQEPDWKTLKVDSAKGFWDAHKAWQNRIDLARQHSRIGDILLLADEAPVAAFRADAWITAGVALRKSGQFLFALEVLERGLEVEGHNLVGLQEKGLCLQRLALEKADGYSLERARKHYESVLDRFPDDAETWGLYARVDKDAWISEWRAEGATLDEIREEAEEEEALLRKAIDGYLKGFRNDPSHYYPGINALTLMCLHHHLTDEEEFQDKIPCLAGAVRFAAECKAEKSDHDKSELYWAKATIGDLEVLTGSTKSVKKAYKDAVAQNQRDWFSLHSCRDQLELIRLLGFQPANVEAGLAVFDKALQKLNKPESSWKPRKVFLFSGHMIDTADRSTPRFPQEKEEIAASRIAEVLEELGASSEDLAYTQGACGGDLLFTESCLVRGVKVAWLQPFSEAKFIKKSVVRAGEHWVERYYAAKDGLFAPPLGAPEILGEVPRYTAEGYPYVRCNKWLLYTALSHGIQNVFFICLWNGEGGDGPGGTEHMYNEVKKRTGQVRWIKTQDL